MLIEYMNDEVLLNISLTVATIGIIILLLLSYYDKIPEKQFNEITLKDINNKVTIKGTIIQEYKHNNSMTLKLKQECVIDVFLFEQLNFTIGSNVSVTGTVQEYNGKMEVVADKIIEKS